MGVTLFKTENYAFCRRKKTKKKTRNEYENIN